MDTELERTAAEALDQRRRARLHRERRVVEDLSEVEFLIDGRRYVNFSSNDYLGLRGHPKLTQAIAKATLEKGAGSGASALITGYSAALASAERALAAWKGTQSAVLLPSGCQANHAAVGALAGMARAAGKSVRFLMDKLVHASLVDAVRASEKPMRLFGHNDLGKLERLLSARTEASQLDVVITESIFSMDGDAADLAGLAALRRRFGFALLVDEAHGSGIYGSAGSGYAAELGLTGDIDVFVVTLSKALGMVGGAVCGSERLCECVVNFGRAYIYSTAVPPAVGPGCEAALRLLRDEPARQRRVRELAARVRAELAAAAYEIPAGDSPIVPVIVGEEQATLELAEKLKEKGMLVVAVRPPTVRRGSSRLRVTLSSAHSDEQVAHLVAALMECKCNRSM